MLLSFGRVLGQEVFEFDQSVEVVQNAKTLDLAWAGGLNASHYHSIDLDLDGTADLVVFDRTSNKISCFLWKDGRYHYSPSYEMLFPKDLNGWIVVEDFNCDGIKDIFTSATFGINAYKGVVKNDVLQWELAIDPINTIGFSGPVNLQVNISDIPAITDIDDDGDLDIFVFNFAVGGTIEFHENISDQDGEACGLNFKRKTVRWGDFQECSCGVYAFGEACAESNGKLQSGQKVVHAGGKSLLIFDYDGDGVKDMVFGDETCQNLVFFKNYGNNVVASFLSVTEPFPPNQVTPDFFFPNASYLDLDHDGLNDLIISPNLSDNPSNLVNYTQSNWFYKNDGTAQHPVFSFVQDNFLQALMIDRGENAVPALKDLTGDGLTDLLLGHRGAHAGGNYYATLAFYKNTGSAEDPAFTLEEEDFLGLSAHNLIEIYPGFADVNGDGYPDLYFTGVTKSPRMISIYYILSEEGSFLKSASVSVLPVSVASNDKVTLGKLSGDQFADIIIARTTGRLDYFEFSGTEAAPSYTLRSDKFAGFTDKFENRNLIPFLTDYQGDGTVDLLLSNADGNLLSIPDMSTHTTGLSGVDSIIVADTRLDRRDAYRFGRQSRIAFGALFKGEKPSLLVGNRQGGLYLLRNTEGRINPVDEENLVLEIFPNPTEGAFKIKTNQPVEVTVFDITGRLIMTPAFQPQTTTYELSGAFLSAGVYIVKVTASNGKHKAKKLVVW